MKQRLKVLFISIISVVLTAAFPILAQDATDSTAFEQALPENTISSLYAFIRTYPTSSFTADANERLSALIEGDLTPWIFSYHPSSDPISMQCATGIKTTKPNTGYPFPESDIIAWNGKPDKSVVAIVNVKFGSETYPVALYFDDEKLANQLKRSKRVPSGMVARFDKVFSFELKAWVEGFIYVLPFEQ